MVELGNEMIKEDDRAVLLEGGLTKSASAKLSTSSIKSNLIKCVDGVCFSSLSFCIVHMLLIVQPISTSLGLV